MIIPVSAWPHLNAHLRLIQFLSQHRQLADSSTEFSPNLSVFCSDGLRDPLGICRLPNYSLHYPDLCSATPDALITVNIMC